MAQGAWVDGAAAAGEHQSRFTATKTATMTITPFGGLIIALIMAAVVFIFFQIGRSHLEREDRGGDAAAAPSPATIAPAAPTLPASGAAPTGVPRAIDDPRVLAIAEKFYCKCGSCEGGDLVSTCGCDHPGGAQEVMTFIAARLAENMPEPAVIAAVNKQYPGYMR